MLGATRKKIIGLSFRASNYSHSFDPTTVDESLFIELALSPFVKAAFPMDDKLQRSG